MRRIDFGPIDVSVTEEEILADLLYPAGRRGSVTSTNRRRPRRALARATRTRTITWQDPLPAPPRAPS